MALLLRDVGEVTHGLQRQRVSRSKYAMFACERLPLHFLRFCIVSFDIYNPTKLSHRLQRFWVIRPKQAQARIECTFGQFMSTRIEAKVLVSRRHDLRHLRLHLRVFRQSSAHIV